MCPDFLPCTAVARTSHHHSQRRCLSHPLLLSPATHALLRTGVHRRLARHRAEACTTVPCRSCTFPELPSWFVPTKPIVTGPWSSSVPLRETVQAHPRLQLLTLWIRFQRYLLHSPLILFQRRLRLLSPHPGETRPGWDLGPLPLCIRDHAGGPLLLSKPGHLARVSIRGLDPSRRLLQLIRVRHPNYPRLRGSGARCLAAIRFQGTSIFMPGTSMEGHTMTYRH